MENKFKKLILCWWFWVIVAIVSYIIMILIPIDWKGFGEGTWKGISPYGTFFAYLTQIAWIIVVILLIMKGIKRIQKSKINDYWKISFTIIGIIGIIAFTFFYVRQYIPQEFNPDEYVKTTLQEEGYEVIFNYYSELGLNETWASVKMKSLGDKNEQVWTALTTMGVVYKNATRYIITILTPEKECFYSIDGNIYRNWVNSKDSNVWTYIKSQIEKETESCS